MNSVYEQYLTALGEIAQADYLAFQASNELYPLFTDLKRLISHYHDVIVKFDTVQGELAGFVSALDYDERDFDGNQALLKDLEELDRKLKALESDVFRGNRSKRSRDFVTRVYADTSLSSITEAMSEVNAFHNGMLERRIRANERHSTARKLVWTIIAVAIVVVVIMLDA